MKSWAWPFLFGVVVTGVPASDIRTHLSNMLSTDSMNNPGKDVINCDFQLPAQILQSLRLHQDDSSVYGVTSYDNILIQSGACQLRSRRRSLNAKTSLLTEGHNHPSQYV